MVEPRDRGSQTLLEVLADALSGASAYNKNDQTPPAAVLWPDPDREWEPLIPLLQKRLPLVALGSYDPEVRTGPVCWIRCVVSRTLPDVTFPTDGVPIIYLPGVSRSELRGGDDCSEELRPLAELCYRGVVWTRKGSREWTVPAFLQSPEIGVSADVTRDEDTRKALSRALLPLSREPVSRLRKQVPLRAVFFNGLLNPDEVAMLLLWLNDPDGYPKQLSGGAWEAFGEQCRHDYGFHPRQDGPITAARLLGERERPWDVVWGRFAEAPRSYPNIAVLLEKAFAESPRTLFDNEDSWPQVNLEAEGRLRGDLLSMSELGPDQARERIAQLESEHGRRRSWVWATLGHSPLALSLEHLASLAVATARPCASHSLGDLAQLYAEVGWCVDSAVLEALAVVTSNKDVQAVGVSVRALYREWLECSANSFQDAVLRDLAGGRGYPATPVAEVPPGTCLLHTDALRYDLGQRLAQALRRMDLSVDVEWRLAALPTVTGTAKPAVSPVAPSLKGGPGFDAATEEGTTVRADLLRRLLVEAGFQVLLGDEAGDPTKVAWTETGAIDSYGHEHGWRIAHHLDGELGLLAERIAGLLEAGWQRVQVITDHGWLLLPGRLPKIELKEHVCEARKPRCARLRDKSTTDFPMVPWHWDEDVRIAVPPGIACFEAGKEYEHGGLSAQECVVPMITVRKVGGSGPDEASIGQVNWSGLRCKVTVSGAASDLLVDIRTKPADSTSSLVSQRRAVAGDMEATLLIPDDQLEGQAAVVVLLNSEGSIVAQKHTTVGG